jgi:23S rRNA (cytosine1962-C5)-methyltransferase
MKEFAKVILNPGKEQAVKRFHPWVFSGAIKKIQADDDMNDGDVVEVFSSQNEYLGMGHFQEGTITVRMFSFEKVQPDIDFWTKKIRDAYQFRKNIGLINGHTNVYRLIFGEGDGLPGLIIDFYNGTAVIQSHSIGMHLIKNDLVEALVRVLGKDLQSVYDKSSETMPKNSEIKSANGVLYGASQNNIVTENGNKFYVDWEEGQKTGFFIDQRENRELLAKYSKGKVVLNTFCYTGGFSVYAGNAGAKEVHSVDSSKKAIVLTDKNIQLNNISNHQSFAVDTFDFLKGRENLYDIIILDPPAFAKHKNVRHNATMGYKRLNAEAIKQIKPGGLLFTFSCSQVVDKYLFNHTIMSAAILAGRKVKIIHQLAQPADHPINIFHPEGEYLKGLVLYVD